MIIATRRTKNADQDKGNADKEIEFEGHRVWVTVIMIMIVLNFKTMTIARAKVLSHLRLVLKPNQNPGGMYQSLAPRSVTLSKSPTSVVAIKRPPR